MKISVIIPTYNGKHKLRNILSTLSCQNIKDFETIVVIDGSSDRTVEFLNQNNFGLNLMIHSQENRGRAAVRNKGVELASGELLIFFDDDMRLESQCLEAHVNHHYKYPGSILTGAQIDDLDKASTDFQKYKCDLSRAWAANLKKEKDQPLPFSDLYLTAANFSITKELFNQVGGFNEQLRDCEDYDFAVRAYNLNIAIYYSERAFGWHDDFQTPQSFIKRQLDYKQYNEVLYQLYPEQYSHLLQSRLNKPGKLKAAFFAIFQSKKWVTAIDKGKFAFLPKKLRYQLYTWIITAQSTYKAPD